jgi:DNA-binding XRE family transcriptional regulator
MRFDIQKIDGKVVMSTETFEDMMDIIAFDAAKADDGETFPLSVLDAMLGGESPVRVFRKHRGLSQDALAERVGVSKTTISEIESGRKTGSVETLLAIAKALNVEIGDLVE